MPLEAPVMTTRLPCNVRRAMTRCGAARGSGSVLVDNTIGQRLDRRRPDRQRRNAGVGNMPADGRFAGIDLAKVLLRQAAMHDNAIFGVLLRQDLTLAGQPGQQPAVVDAHLDVDVEKRTAQGLAHRAGQLLQAHPLAH